MDKDNLMIPLMNAFPGLNGRLPHLQLGEFPTPIEPLAGLASQLGRKNLFIKRDDLSGAAYGGNKIRKLEFLLADAKEKGAVRVITTGAAGSNHALATALYSKQAGLAATLVLGEQPPGAVVRDNLLMDAYLGAEMVYEEDYARLHGVIDGLMQKYTALDGVAPYRIPAGGSSVTGGIGFVNAAFELREQIRQGVMDEPAAIVVALGTMGTAAGLLLGLKAAGLKSRVIAARVIFSVIANPVKFKTLFTGINEKLRALDPAFPIVIYPKNDIVFCDDYYEPGYGLAPKKVFDALSLIEQTDSIHLDITYTGKAFAAFLDEANKGGDAPILFWNTKNSRDLPVESKKIDYHTLPEAFHKYFTE
jgi:D-cysteine desulfhydrase